MLKGGGEPDLSALVDPIAVSDPWLAASRAGKRLRAVPRATVSARPIGRL